MPNLQFRPFRDIRERLWDPRLISMTLASLSAGTLIGVVGGSFRWCLVEADQLRDRLIVWSHGSLRGLDYSRHSSAFVCGCCTPARAEGGP